VPVIFLALDTVFNHEMLQNGEYGKFFTKDLGDLKSLIEFMDSKPSVVKSMKKNSRNGLGKKYNWHEITNKYVEVFEQLLK
jgi:glycosyltransferase involved in cell wall biosynthesis